MRITRFQSTLAVTALAFAVAAQSGLAQSAADLANAAGAAGVDTSSMASMAASEILSVDNFDPDAVKTLIDQANLDDATKGTLKTGVDKAAENPELVQATLDQVKAAIGL